MCLATMMSYIWPTREEMGPRVLSYDIEQNGTVKVKVPKKQLRQGSVRIAANQAGREYTAWTEDNRSDAYKSLRKVVDVWEKNKIAEQYLVYGKQEVGKKPFHWEAVPYSNKSSFVGRFWQQLCVFYNVIFGGAKTEETEEEADAYKKLFTDSDFSVESVADKVDDMVKGDDHFCKDPVINKQQVLEGERVRVLFDHKPLGEQHFLVMPKEHYTTFKEVPEDVYMEATELIQKLIKHYCSSEDSEFKNVYIFHKSGPDAGQSVEHFHIHVIFTSNKVKDSFAKLKFFLKMTLPSSPMKDSALKDRVNKLKSELSCLKASE